MAASHICDLVLGQLLQHTPDFLLIGVFLEARIKVFPPFKEHRLADELEPRGKFQGRVVEQLLELVGSDVLCCLDFIGVCVDVNLRLDEQDVID